MSETGHSGSGRSFEWNQRRLDAARLIAEGRLTGDAIARQLGIGRATLTRWRARPEFEARVAELVQRFRDEFDRQWKAHLDQQMARWRAQRGTRR